MCDPRPTAKSSLAASEIKTIDGKTRYRGENDHRREIETERRREQPPEEKWNRCSLFQPVKSSFVAYLAGADDDDVDRRGLITMIMTMTSRNDRLEWQSLRRRVNCASRNNACWISAPIIRHCVTHKTSAESDTCVSASWCSSLSLSLSLQVVAKYVQNTFVCDQRLYVCDSSNFNRIVTSILFRPFVNASVRFFTSPLESWRVTNMRHPVYISHSLIQPDEKREFQQTVRRSRDDHARLRYASRWNEIASDCIDRSKRWHVRRVKLKAAIAAESWRRERCAYIV